MTANLQRVVVPHTTKAAWLEERRKDITSTEVSALFGASPYLTGFELWHMKNGTLPDEIEETERMRWGLRLQDPIARGVIEDNGWAGQADTSYMRIPSLRLGASFDWRVSIGGAPMRHLEIKNVDSQAYREGWLIEFSENDEGQITSGDVEAPPYMELQLQQQMLVAGEDSITLAALIGGNHALIVHRVADLEVHDAIIEKTAHFWESIKAKKPPDPDYYRDMSAIKRLHPDIVGEVIQLVEEDRITKLMREHKVLSANAKVNKEDADARRAEILHLIGSAPGVKGPAGKITRYPVSESVRTTVYKARVDARITHAKE